jgi:hypothetical protein
MVIDARVCGSHFHLDGVDYFRGHAEAVQIGDAGEKKTPGTQGSHLAARERVPRDSLKIQCATEIDLHRVAVSASDIGASITIPGVGSLGAATLARQLEDQTLTLVKLETLPQDIVAAANDAPRVITALLHAGNAGRLVHQVLVILEMKTALNLTRSARFEVSGDDECWAITGIGNCGSRTSVTLTPATTFAYLLLKPKWDVHPLHNTKRIAAWEDDPWSRDDAV